MAFIAINLNQKVYNLCTSRLFVLIMASLRYNYFGGYLDRKQLQQIDRY